MLSVSRKEVADSVRSKIKRTILITGASGLLGGALFRALSAGDADVTGLFGRSSSPAPEGIAGGGVDLADAARLTRILDQTVPSLLVNCAAMPDIVPCEADPGGARAVNSAAPALMAAWCRARGARFVHFSTDQVFDGTGSFYGENDPPAPVHRYGITKAAGESSVLDANPDSVVARLSLIYGVSPSGRRSASEGLINAFGQGRTLRLFTNEYRTPVLVDDLVRAVLFLADSDFSGLIHLAGPDRLSRFEFGCALASRFGLRSDLIESTLSEGLKASPPRPLDLSLGIDLASRTLPFRIRSVEEGLRELPDL